MASREGYTAGWLDSSIHDFLIDLPRAFPSMATALITAIDSSPDVVGLLDRSPELRGIKPIAEPLGRGIVVPTRVLLEREKTHPIFFGFDEVWFCRKPPRAPRPDSVSMLYGPGRVREEELERIALWMAQSDCSLGLGDGLGLNFVIKARGLVQHLLSHTLQEPSTRV